MQLRLIKKKTIPSNISVLYFLMILLFAFGCKSDDPVVPSGPSDPSNPNDPGNDPDMEIPVIIPNGDEQFLTLDSDYIFDQERLPVFELTIPTNALAQIDSDPTKEEYVEASLTFEGETVSPVGVRYKGSIGAFINCVSGNDWTNPSGRKTCTKLSMKIKINWEGADYKFYGLKKIQLHSQNNDPSQMRERLGYWLFREMKVRAPRAVHAKLVINGVYSGLYAFVEQIDGRFTKYHFDDGDGNLYKEIWPIDSDGRAFSESTYLQHLKTNEDDNPSAVLIRSFGQEIENASPETIQEVVANRMKTKKIISYAVVDRTIRNDDGAFHWYCNGGECSPHNFYWYEEPSKGRLHLIPWDLDHAFENMRINKNPVTPIADEWGEKRANCQPFSFGVFQLRQRSAACDKLTGSWANIDGYQERLEEFKEGPFSETQINMVLNAWENQIREATLEAEQTHDDALPTSNWEQALGELKNDLEFARNN